MFQPDFGGLPPGVLRAQARLAVYPAVAVLAFLVFSRMTVGEWFVSSGFFVPDETLRGQPVAVYRKVVEGIQLLGGEWLLRFSQVAVLLIGVLGLASAGRAPMLIPLALFGAGALPVSAYLAGHPFRMRYEIPLVMACALTLTAVVYTPFGIVDPPTDLPAEAWLSIAVLALVCTALAFVIFLDLIKVAGPTRSTIITYVNPAVAILLGVLLLDERLTTGMLVGAKTGIAAIAGLCAGGALSVLGLRMTRFEDSEGGRWYTPDPWIGMALTALMLGRLAYRFVKVRSLTDIALQDASAMSALHRSPLTLAIAALLVGYWLGYCIGLLRRARTPLAATA